MTTSETEDYELVEGELVLLPSASPLHADVRGRLEHLLRSYFESHPIGVVLGEVDCRINEELVRRPDLSILLSGRLN